MMQDPNEIKERIISALKSKGPSLPVHIASEIKSSILFSSAFLGELVSEKKIRMSNMRVGSSPIYFIPGQESLLEKFFGYLRSKEKDAFLLLKEKKFLIDSKQNPAIRVALREIKDFAIPFRSDGEIVWRYFLVPESEFKIAKVTEEKKEKPLEIKAEKPVFVVAERETQKSLDIFSKESKEEPEIKPKKRKAYGRKVSNKENEFLNSVKEFLSENSIELLDIKSSGKKEIILKVRDKGVETLLVAYNKNKINEGDIIKASKKASKENLPYMVIGSGGPLKKIDGLIEALKGLSSIKKIK